VRVTGTTNVKLKMYVEDFGQRKEEVKSGLRSGSITTVRKLHLQASHGSCRTRRFSIADNQYVYVYDRGGYGDLQGED